MVVLGFDPGNSEATLTWRQGATVRHLTAPSFVGSGSLEELRRVRGGAGGEGLQKDEMVLVHDGASYYVGQLALEEARDARAARNDVSRYWNGHTLRLLLALAGQAGITGSVRIMTGLPISAWTPGNKRYVQTALIGKHAYALSGKDRTLTIEAVGVMMEGAAALVNYTISDAPYAVIDVGGRTTDLFWSQGTKPVTKWCESGNVGVEKIADALRQEVLEKHQRELYPHEARAILRAHAAGEPLPPLYVRGKELHLNGSVSAAISAASQHVISYVAQVWGDDRGEVASNAARVLLIGGGAYFFADALRVIIPHIEVSRAPELANALGYLSVGLSASEEAWARNR